MPSWTSTLRNAVGGKSDAPPASPKQIRNKFYQRLREFTAWSPWGDKPDHTNANSEYIPIAGLFVKQYDYAAELKKLIEFGWKAATKPTGPRPVGGFTIGRSRPDVAPGFKEPPSPLRQAFGHKMASNWDHMALFEQVGAYSFRGDTRGPESVQAAGGFFPPSMRTDDSYIQSISSEFVNYMERKEGMKLDAPGRAQMEQEVTGYIRNQLNPADRKLLTEYHFWRQVLTNEQMHLQGMTNDSFLKGYISTSRNVSICMDGATGKLGGKGTQTTASGWIYALRIDSGFLLKTGVGGISKKEAEIAHLGPVTWDKVYAFANVGMGVERVVYIRNLFDQQDYNGFKLVLASLSYVVQL